MNWSCIGHVRIVLTSVGGWGSRVVGEEWGLTDAVAVSGNAMFDIAGFTDAVAVFGNATCVTGPWRAIPAPDRIFREEDQSQPETGYPSTRLNIHVMVRLIQAFRS